MRIKGSDLRKIIKEEITRAHRMNEAGFSGSPPTDEEIDSFEFGPSARLISVEPASEEEQIAEASVSKLAIAHQFVRKLVNLVGPGSRPNALRDALTMNPGAEIEFTGAVKEFSFISSTALEKNLLLRSIAQERGENLHSSWSGRLDFEEMTVDGVPMPPDVVNSFDYESVGKKVGIVATTGKPVVFMASISLTDVTGINNFSDISLLDIPKSGENMDMVVRNLRDYVEEQVVIR